MIVFKDAGTKDDPRFKFVITAPVLVVAHATETCPNVTQGNAATSRVTIVTNVGDNLFQTNATVAQAHPTTSAVTASPVQSATLDSETGPGATQAHPTTSSVTLTPAQSVPIDIDPAWCFTA